MIHYDPSDWASVLANFHKSDILRRVARNAAGIGLYAVAVVVVVEEVIGAEIMIQASVFSLIGIILGLLLAFRTNTAYDRWWEGRKLWGALVNRSRALAQALDVLLPADAGAERRAFAEGLADFAMGVKGHLRDDFTLQGLETHDPDALDAIRSAVHVPNALSTLLFRRVGGLIRRGDLPRESLLVLAPQFDALHDIVGGCERIKKTPIPFSYNTYIKQFIVAYTLALPFGLVQEFGYYAVPAVMFVFYAMMGVELMAVEIEQPFGYDCNDLPLEDICRTIRASVEEILVPAQAEAEALANPPRSEGDSVYIYH